MPIESQKVVVDYYYGYEVDKLKGCLNVAIKKDGDKAKVFMCKKSLPFMLADLTQALQEAGFTLQAEPPLYEKPQVSPVVLEPLFDFNEDQVLEIPISPVYSCKGYFSQKFETKLRNKLDKSRELIQFEGRWKNEMEKEFNITGKKVFIGASVRRASFQCQEGY